MSKDKEHCIEECQMLQTIPEWEYEECPKPSAETFNFTRDVIESLPHAPHSVWTEDGELIVRYKTDQGDIDVSVFHYAKKDTTKEATDE